jgi:hypothetical protein
MLGKSVFDSYGRQAGILLGYSVDPSGEVSSIAVDRGTEGFQEFETDRFRIENEAIVIAPRWEAECQEMSENLGGVQDRLAFLKQLAKQMGIPKSKVDQLIKKSDRKLYDLLQSYKVLAELMALRGFEIESQIEDLDDFVANLSAQREAGNIDDATYEAIVENCRALRTRNLREVEDLSKTSKTLRESGRAKAEEEPDPASTRRRARAKGPQLIAEMP